MPNGPVGDIIDNRKDNPSEEEVFIRAIERYKREHCRPLPTYGEVLEVLRSLGYRKVAEKTGAPLVKKGERRKRNIPAAIDHRAGS